MNQIELFKIIRIHWEYLMSYNCKLFVLMIVDWNYNCLLKIIISCMKLYNKGQIFGKNNYLKPYNYWNWIEILETKQLYIKYLY